MTSVIDIIYLILFRFDSLCFCLVHVCRFLIPLPCLLYANLDYVYVFCTLTLDYVYTLT